MINLHRWNVLGQTFTETHTQWWQNTNILYHTRLHSHLHSKKKSLQKKQSKASKASLPRTDYLLHYTRVSHVFGLKLISAVGSKEKTFSALGCETKSYNDMREFTSDSIALNITHIFNPSWVQCQLYSLWKQIDQTTDWSKINMKNVKLHVQVHVLVPALVPKYVHLI